MKKIIYKFIFIFLLLPQSIYAEFFISAKDSCKYDSDTYSYEIGPTVAPADLRIKVGPLVSNADIRIKLVQDPREADLIFVDDKILHTLPVEITLTRSVDITICKKSSTANKKIKIGPDVSFSNIKVKFPDL